MATTLKLTGVQAISGGVLDLNGTNTGMASISLMPGWRPRVAKRRRSVLGGKRVEDVVESIPLRVYGTTELECVTALEMLAAAMNQAAAWKDGAAVDPVIINYAINNTTLGTPLKAAVLGTPVDAADILELPITFNQNLQVFEVNPLTLPLERRGEWLGVEESGTSSTVDNGDSMSISLTATTNPSPTVLRLGAFNSAGNDKTWGGFLLLAESSDDIAIANAEIVAGTTGYSSVADGANLARNTNILRYTPPSTSYLGTSQDGTISFNEDAHLIGVFINARNTSSDYYFNVKMTYGQYLAVNTFSGVDSAPLTIPAGATNPRWYFIGVTTLRTELKSWLVSAQVENTTGSPLLEIDTVVFVNMATVKIISLEDVTSLANWSAGNTEITIDHSLLSAQKSRVYAEKTADPSYPLGRFGYSGNATLHTNSDTLTSLYLSTGGNSDSHWRRSDAVGAVMDLYTKATRRPAYLVPR